MCLFYMKQCMVTNKMLGNIKIFVQVGQDSRTPDNVVNHLHITKYFRYVTST